VGHRRIGGAPGELSKRIIFFDFSSDIRADSQSIVLQPHAAYLAKNPAQKVRLEEHTDGRWLA
jgi:outer membrane protein OmpA-like peptidoglycan-associated protein